MKQTLIAIVVLLAPVTCTQAETSTLLNERQARRSPAWVTGGVMYQIQPRAFTPEGTLKAATLRLPKVADIGVDIANDAYDNRIEKAWGAQRVRAMLVTIFALDGTPMLYNGQEVADTARHSIFGRASIDWASSTSPTAEKRFSFCRRLCAMRHAERALTRGAVVWLDNDQPNSVLSFLRRTTDEEILSVVNLSSRTIDVRITLPDRTKWPGSTLITQGAKVEKNDSGFALKLDRFGYLIAKRK